MRRAERQSGHRQCVRDASRRREAVSGRHFERLGGPVSGRNRAGGDFVASVTLSMRPMRAACTLEVAVVRARKSLQRRQQPGESGRRVARGARTSSSVSGLVVWG